MTPLFSDEDADLRLLTWTPKKRYAHHWFREAAGRVDRSAHRIVLARMMGRPLLKAEQADHINGVRDDNRRSNLRLATNKQNLENRTSRNRNNSSGFRGVSWHKASGKWEAYVRHHKKRLHMGLHATAETAAQAAAAKRAELGFRTCLE